MRGLRDAIPPEERARMTAEIEARVVGLPTLRGASVVLMFWSFGSEVPTDGIARRLAAEGRRLLVPYLRDNEMEAAELRPGQSLVATNYGPMEPADPSPVDPGDIDIALSPGLAFDRHGYRIGYGGGHFDRYLARMPRDAARVGIGYHQQVLPAIPHGPDDERLDFVVTDGETIVCPPRRPPP
jgi:5-formyltetrahydrofolate cyclo-ligase